MEFAFPFNVRFSILSRMKIIVSSLKSRKLTKAQIDCVFFFGSSIGIFNLFICICATKRKRLFFAHYFDDIWFLVLRQNCCVRLGGLLLLRWHRPRKRKDIFYSRVFSLISRRRCDRTHPRQNILVQQKIDSISWHRQQAQRHSTHRGKMPNLIYACFHRFDCEFKCRNQLNKK